MEASKDQSAGPVNSAKSKLRYPLRSGSKPKDERSAMAEISNSSASKRGRPFSNVSKSVSVLELSGKDKSDKPPRRLSIPPKSSVSPIPRSIGNITPISETRTKKIASKSQGKSDTPASDVSKSSARKKFSVLSSVSYWSSQIKLSESASKHPISLGFFKLALDSGCEPLQKMRDELRSYVRRHNLLELGEPVKELLRSYNISENLENSQGSETSSQVPEEGTQSSDEDIRSSSTARALNLNKPKSSVAENVRASSTTTVACPSSMAKNRASINKDLINKSTAKLRPVKDTGSNLKKKTAVESNAVKEKIKSGGKKSPVAKDVVADPLPAEEETVQDDKENLYNGEFTSQGPVWRTALFKNGREYNLPPSRIGSPDHFEWLSMYKSNRMLYKWKRSTP